MAMGADLMQLDFLGFGDEAKLLGSSQKDPAVAGLIRQIQELQRELAREKSLWQEDHHQQSKFLLRQEQRRWQEWQEGLGGDEPSNTSCTLLEDLQQCRDLQRTVSQMKNQLKSHGLSHQQAKATQVEGKEAKEVDQGICMPLRGPQQKEGDPGQVHGSESRQKEPCPSRESESVGETEVGEATAARSQDDAAKKSTTESKEEAAEVGEEAKGASPRMEDTGVARQQVQESQKASTEVLEPREDKEDNQAASEAQDVAKAKGKGKGCKGKGGKGPPLPTSKAMAKSAVKIREIKKSLVTLHWKALPALNETNATVAKDPLLQNCRDLLSLAKGSEVTPGASDSVGIIDFAESAQASQAGVFDDVDVCADLPEAMDEVYFKRREAAVQLLGPANTNKTSFLDEKQCRMLGILMGKYRMKNKEESQRQIVATMKHAVLSCRYDILKEEGLSMLRKVVRDARETNAISKYVAAHGEGALKKLKDPWLHRLVYEILKVPQIEERLECMLFQTAFQESLEKCSRNINVMCEALYTVDDKLDSLRELFNIAHRFGTALNSNCLAPQAPQGFSLLSLERLAQTKSTASPKHNMLHFVLAMMKPEMAAKLFPDEDLRILSTAKSTKSFTVYQDCAELTQGFFALREICETGKYQSGKGEKVKIERRRMTKAPLDREECIDLDDCFHSVMKDFVERNEGKVNQITRGCYSVFVLYKEKALFFDDLASVYPPPKDDQDSKVDLIAVIYKLAMQVRTHLAEVEQDGLRQNLAATRDVEQ